jgi:hypothetical protein
MPLGIVEFVGKALHLVKHNLLDKCRVNENAFAPE